MHSDLRGTFHEQETIAWNIEVLCIVQKLNHDTHVFLFYYIYNIRY